MSLRPKRTNPAFRLVEVLTIGGVMLLTGCGPKRLRVDFASYENSFAVTSNREVLLNLARLEQHDPTYFFKLGQISSSYRMEGSFAGSGSYNPLTNTAGAGNPAGGGAPGFIYENDPSFSFIPVSDQTNAQLLLQPVSENAFYSLYEQGWRVDQLFRLMVDRIVVTLPPDPTNPTDQGCRVEVIRNAPPPAIYGTDFSQSASEIDRYVVFLRFSAAVYALQKHNLLLLRAARFFTPIDQASFIPNTTSADVQKGTSQIPGDENGSGPRPGAAGTPPASGNTPLNLTVVVGNQGGGGGDSVGKNSQIPAAKDFNDAAAKSEEWILEGGDADGKGGAWVLGQIVLDPTFQLNRMESDASAAPDRVYGQRVKTVENMLRSQLLPNDPSVAQLAQAPELTDILETLFSGFTIGGSSTEQDAGIGPCTSEGGNRKHYVVTSHLVLRSLLGIMAAAAQEQAFYDALARSGQDPQIPMGKDDLLESVHEGQLVAQGLDPRNQDDPAYLYRASAVAGNALTFSQLVPPIERLPVLRLRWPNYVKPPIEHLSFNPKEFGLATDYKGKDYVVADVDPASVDPTQFARENETWNRDMFRLINELSSQVTVDISKFPLPEVLQLRTE
jgi:hypothetical protein